MKENILQQKSYAFSLRVVKLTKLLRKKHEYDLASQFFRSGTSIGANVEEAIGGQSEKDFFAKLCISYKEARETKYWLKLIRDGNILPSEGVTPLIQDCEILIRIIGKILSTIRKKRTR